jgi:DNA-binding transcriptional ArsR family regulator
MKRTTVLAALAALSQETRLDIFRLLVVAGDAGLPAGEIAARLGVQAPTLSFHLSHLKRARLVTYRRDSRSLIYAANYAVMTGLVAYLTENCCRGAGADGLPEACAPGAAACAPGPSGGNADAKPRGGRPAHPPRTLAHGKRKAAGLAS